MAGKAEYNNLMAKKPIDYPRDSLFRLNMCPYCKIFITRDKLRFFYCFNLSEARGGKFCTKDDFSCCPLINNKGFEED